MSIYSALVQPLRGPKLAEMNRRCQDRYSTEAEATSQTLEGLDPLFWGATVKDISTGGIGLSMCYPFRPGTFLSVNLKNREGVTQSVLARVVHVRDLPDGTWNIGCEFVTPMSNSELDIFVE